MSRHFLLFVTLNIWFSSFGQVSAKYYWETRYESGGVALTTYHELVYNGKQSLFAKIDTILSVNENISYVRSSEFKGFFYDEEKKCFYFMGYVVGKPFPVMDCTAHDIMKWEMLTGNGPEILGYKTLIAKTKFRGRSFIAHYAPELPFNTGPFKFNGLPGMILELYSDEGKHYFKASGIKVSTNFQPIKNPYEAQNIPKYITYEQFKDLSIKKWKENITKLNVTETEGFTYSSKDGSIELTKE